MEEPITIGRLRVFTMVQRSENSTPSGSNERVEEEKVESESEGSFVRWQRITREQLGTTVHVILTLSTGVLAYGSSLVLGKEAAHLSKWPAIAVSLCAAPLFAICGSRSLG